MDSETLFLLIQLGIFSWMENKSKDYPKKDLVLERKWQHVQYRNRFKH